MTGCSEPRQGPPPSHSTALEDYANTSAGEKLSRLEKQHLGQLGFLIVGQPRAAFTSRVVLTELAEKSLDLQYYIWEEDASGRILAEKLVSAADRGVRVRVLLDDINLGGRDDVIASLDAHPNIEIRLFNPFAHRQFRFLDFLVDFKRVNRRMHNKLMVMDNSLAIIGGRNIGDHYFGVSEGANFRNLDIAAGGPVVRETSSVFDYFWNGEWSVPISSLVDRTYTKQDLEEVLSAIRSQIEGSRFPYPLEPDVADLKSNFMTIIDNLIWSRGSMIWDDPASVIETGETQRISNAVYLRLQSLQNEFLIESAYFVPRDVAIKTIQKLRNDGIRVRILTNSLASNDVLAAHAGYSQRRKELIESGAL